MGGWEDVKSPSGNTAKCVKDNVFNSLICIKNRRPCLDVAKVICIDNLSEPLEISSTDSPFEYKKCFCILSYFEASVNSLSIDRTSTLSHWTYWSLKVVKL